jgi:hypothetical protein
MIEEQFTQLQLYLRDEKGLIAERQRLSTGGHLITVRNIPIRSGWSRATTDVLFVAPPGYPAARPDCFWVSPQLRLANGSPPQNTNESNVISGDPMPGRSITWFSWHLQTWDPNKDKLATFYSAIVKRLIPAR